MSQPFRALVVDDEDLYAQAIEREISVRQGIFCDLAYNCREALEFAASRQYGVILLESSPAGRRRHSHHPSASRAAT